MASAWGSRTSPALLERLRQAPADQAAWARFVERYAPRVYGWCRQWGLQEADAQDVTQVVLLRLAEKMRSFRYDPEGSFRGWLRTLTCRAWCDFVASQRRAGRGSGGPAVALQTLEACTDLARRLEDEFDREVLEEAMARVRLRVQPHTWEAFRLLALEGLPGARVAQELHMNVATAFVARSKVQKLLREEVRRLEGPDREEDL
jgi:RNA polymerase sigma factor (sigma-70 family)